MVSLHLSQDPVADKFISTDHFALMMGMVLDQQIPIERAFSAPHELTERLGVTRLEPNAIAAMDQQQFRGAFAARPALHRFPKAMADRVHALAVIIHREYGGDPAALWRDARSGEQLLERLAPLPGFGKRKAQIFLALLGKQLGVRPAGWREVAGAYGEEGVAHSVADVTGPETLAKLREYKSAMKSAAKQSPGQASRQTAKQTRKQANKADVEKTRG